MSATPVYPAGTVRALLDTEHVSDATRAALVERLGEGMIEHVPRFLDGAAYATLRAACARLLPQRRATPVHVAAMIDTRLADGIGDGWRYADMPNDGDAYRLGLRGLDEHAVLAFGSLFAALGAGEQDVVLRAVEQGAVAGGAWDRVPARRFFEELLAESAECYYSHPLAQEEMGYVGMADRPGWDALGLNALAPREPRPTSTSADG